MTMIHEIATHMATTPLAALAPLLWGTGLLVVLRRVMRRPVPQRGHEAPAADVVAEDLRPAA